MGVKYQDLQTHFRERFTLQNYLVHTCQITYLPAGFKYVIIYMDNGHGFRICEECQEMTQRGPRLQQESFRVISDLLF